MVRQPRLVIAATRSGDGKTTVAAGLMAAGAYTEAHRAADQA